MILSLLSMVLFGYSFSVVSGGGDYLDVSDEPWLVPGSITAAVNGDTLDVMLSARGASVGLVLSPVPRAGDTVLVTADTLDISVPVVSRLEIRPLERGDIYVMPSYRSGTDPVPEGLFISGSKKLGISVGSGGGITQGTELSIEGMLSSGITINGRISDRDIPLGAGASEALSELDRIYLELQGESWNAEMGDLQWESKGAVPWRNDVTGFRAGVVPGEFLDVSGGYGTTGSERRRSTFLTEEGLQGPYSFAPEGGVTPGSERVFLDGVLLSRGSGADYEMDYSAGLVTFTTKRLIRMEQRVDISFYREGDGFRKNVARGETVLHIADWIAVGFNGFSRGDDTGVPLGFVMTDEIEEVLRNAGENPLDAWIDGGRYAGENNGSYSLDSLSHYTWAGPGQGDWIVEFQRPPEGNGDYIYDSSLGGYIWVGQDNGTHLPRRYVTIPSSNRLAGVTFSGGGGSVEGYSLHSTFSNRTGNLFNTDVSTREGTLSGGDISFRPWETGPMVSFTGRLVTDGFNPPDDLDTDADLAKWGLPSNWKGRDSYATAEVTGEVLTIAGGRRFLEDGGAAEIANAEYHRALGDMNVMVFSRGLFRRGSSTLLSGRMGELGADLSLKMGSFTPFLLPSYTAESWSDSLTGGLFITDVGVNHEVEGWNSTFTAGGELDKRSGTTHPERTLRLGLLANGTGNSWNAGGSVQHSTGWFTGGGSASSDAARVTYSGRTGGIWIHGQYTAGGYISREMDVVYTWVGAGKGNYSYDPQSGEYYSDPSGDYVQTFVPGQGETRALETELNGGFSWSDSTESAGMDGSFGLSASDPDDRLSTYTLAGAFDTGKPGGWTGSISPFLAWDSGTLSRLTVRVSGYDRRDDYSGVGTTREIQRKFEAIPLLKPAEWLEIEIRGATAYRRRALYGTRETDENGISVDPVIITGRGVDIGLKLSIENRSERGGDLDVFSQGLEPHFTLSASGWTSTGRFSAWFIPSGQTVPSWLFDGRQSGWTLQPTLSVGRNLNRWFSINLFYWGQKQPGEDWQQRGGLEGTVNF